MKRRWIALPLAAAAAAAAVPVTAGHAQSSPRTITMTHGKEKMSFDDLAPKTIKRGRLSIGDRIVSQEQLLIDGKPAGTAHTDATITNSSPSTFAHFTAVIQGAYKLADGVVFTSGYVDAADGGDQETVIGGTGAYAGAHGTLTSDDKQTVVTLDG